MARQCVKRKGVAIKTNYIYCENENIDSDDSFGISSENLQSKNNWDLEGLQKLRTQFHPNPLIGYLKINFLQHKIDSLREILK